MDESTIQKGIKHFNHQRWFAAYSFFLDFQLNFESIDHTEGIAMTSRWLTKTREAIVSNQHPKKLMLKGQKICYLPKELATLTELEELSLFSQHLNFKNLCDVFAEFDRPFMLSTAKYPHHEEGVLLIHLDKDVLLDANSLALLQNMRTLELEDWKGNELPKSIGKLTGLQKLNLTASKIQALPPEIGELHQLKELHLPIAPIQELPPEIGQLAELRLLNLNYSGITTLPKEIASLQSLKHLYLKYSSINCFPQEISELTQLETLLLFGSAYPEENLTDLRVLLPNCDISY